MATLLQILAKELKVWPKGKCKAIAQWGNSRVFFWKHGDLVFKQSAWHARTGSALLDADWSLTKKVELASDHETAIINKAMWKAERIKSDSHAVNILNQFAKSVNQNQNALNDKCEGRRYNATFKAKKFNATALRDRIQKIDIVVQELEEERLSLVQSLEAEGFALIDAKREPAEDMSDWRNWEAGDLIECVTESEVVAVLTVGKVYALGVNRGSPYITDDDGDYMSSCISEGHFKFVSRP